MMKKYKVEISYTVTDEALSQGSKCCAILSWNPNGKKDGYEALYAYGDSFSEAKERVVGIFKRLPPTEKLTLEK